MAIDTHIHINSKVIGDVNKEIENVNNSNYLDSVIHVGVNYSTSKESALIAKENKKFYSAVGIHPLYCENEKLDKLISLLINYDKIVAIGEIGLDSSNSNYYDQKRCLIKQIILANNLSLPVIIHSNNANEEIIDIFKNTIKPKYGCVFHCFQPDIDTLNYLIDNNYYVSFAGRIMYPNAKKSIEVAKVVPDDLFLVETDSPYINSNKSKNINNLLYLRNVIEKLAEVRNVSYDEIEKTTTKNAKRLFKKLNSNNN